MSTFWILIGIVFLTYVIYRYVSYELLPKPIDRIGAEKIDISKLQQIIASEQLKSSWMSTAGSTLVFYISPEISDRTSISGNEYASIVQIGSKQNFKILVAPDAGRGYDMAPALLEVFIKGNSQPEIIEIPNVPLQRWTSIAIVKQGRKFNIYVNAKLMVSHMCTAMPDFDETQPLRIGDPRLTGEIALMSLASYPMQAPEIQELISNTVDTDGKPILSSGNTLIPIPTMKDIENIFICPGGNCTTPKKPGPMEEWSSPYA